MLPFLTAYDPLSSSNGSIDPLGALQGYMTLADMLLPGVTTITTRSRYLSMLCAALANAESSRQFAPGASGFSQRRQAVEPFERLWSLACVAARENGVERAADGLRGVTKAEARYKHYAASDEPISLGFKLLKYQGRTGAVGTYWTTMVGSDLVDPDTGALTPEGRGLAADFPPLPLPEKERMRLAEPTKANSISVSVEDLRVWGRRANLVAAGANEKDHLREALTSRDRRDCIYRALSALEKANALPTEWNTAAVKALRDVIAGHEEAVALGLLEVLDAILHFESFHEAVLCVFETLLWWGTEHPNQKIGELVGDTEFRNRANRCIATAGALESYRGQCSRQDVKSAVAGFAAFAHVIQRCKTAKDVFDAVHKRHGQVQSGKTDGGVPKREWVTVNGPRLDLPLPRFQRTKKPVAAKGRVLTHPYRLDSFVHMLRETGALRQSKSA